MSNSPLPSLDIGVRRLELARDHIHLALGLLDRHTGSQPPDHVPVVADRGSDAAKRSGRMGPQNSALVHNRKPTGRMPTTVNGLPLMLQRSPDDFGVAAETALPIPVADDQHILRAGRPVLRVEASPHLRNHAERCEQVCRNQRPPLHAPDRRRR